MIQICGGPDRRALNGVVHSGRYPTPTSFLDNALLVAGLAVHPVTVLWIVAITNAVNLIDGLDGLASGVSAISCRPRCWSLPLIASELQVAIVMAALASACVGFMPYNMNPAKMFMGDTGATFLGFILATMSIQGLFKFYAIDLLRGAVSGAGPAHFRHGLRHHAAGMAHGQSPMHAGPGPHPPPAHRHGSEPEAGGGNAVRHSAVFWACPPWC
ncbi:MAG: MraY family glycosyltransferase [Dysosmobacter sp.]